MAKINIVQKGSSGTVQYTEGWLKKNTCEFYFEFGGGDTVATIWFPAERTNGMRNIPGGAGGTKRSSHLWRKKCAEHRLQSPRSNGKRIVSTL